MSFEAINAVWEHSQAEGSALLVMLCLADHANKKKQHVSWPSIETIAKRTKLSERHVQRCLRDLVKLGELHIRLQSGRSRTNEYALVLPDLPPPFGTAPNGLEALEQGDGKPLPRASDTPEGDTQSAERVTSRAAKGDTHDTQTLSEPKKKNPQDPLNPPKGEREESDFDFWLRSISELKGLPVECVTARERKALHKLPLPPRDQLDLLVRYLTAEAPESNDQGMEAQLLRRRKLKLSTLIRHLPEMCANALQFDKLRNPKACRPAPPRLAAPDWDWRSIGIELFCHPEPFSITGRPITEQDKAEWVARAEDVRLRFLSVPWDSLHITEQQDILDEHRKKEATGAHAVPQSQRQDLRSQPPPHGAVP